MKTKSTKGTQRDSESTLTDKQQTDKLCFQRKVHPITSWFAAKIIQDPRCLHAQVGVRWTDFNNTEELCHCGSAPSSQCPMPALGQAGASGKELLLSSDFSCGAAFGFQTICVGHSLPWLLPLPGNLCTDTVAYKESRNWYMKYIYFLFS